MGGALPSGTIPPPSSKHLRQSSSRKDSDGSGFCRCRVRCWFKPPLLHKFVEKQTFIGAKDGVMHPGTAALSCHQKEVPVCQLPSYRSIVRRYSGSAPSLRATARSSLPFPLADAACVVAKRLRSAPKRTSKSGKIRRHASRHSSVIVPPKRSARLPTAVLPLNRETLLWIGAIVARNGEVFAPVNLRVECSIFQRDAGSSTVAIFHNSVQTVQIG